MSEGQLFELEEDEELRVEVDCAKVNNKSSKTVILNLKSRLETKI